MRFSAGDVRGHIVSQKNDHGASYRRYKVLRRRSGLRNQLLRDFQRHSIFDFCNTIGTKRTWHDVRLESASLIGHLRSSTFRLSTYAVSMSLAGSCFSSESAHQGPSIMGFEDEAEQSFGRPCRQKNGRTKRTHELTSSIVPRGTSFHRSAELWFSPIGFDPERFSCCCRGLLPGPPELGAVNPYAVHDHGQPASQGHDRFLHPAAPGDLHGPRLEPGPFF